MTYRVCFVCTGNICRSPMAEAVFHARVADAGLDDLVEADSAGTGGWHEGEGADPRTVAVLAENGYGLDHTARQFQQSWFSRLDLVVALDAGHLRALRRLAPTERDAAKVRLLRSYDPAADGGDLDVPDPYYGGPDGFGECLEMVEAASTGLLAAVREQVEGRAA
ncbi:low molecular weight protein-tyrosine-phosphatase [Streptomyces coelicoflavus]|uniref:low molecular weight protein-tyrosine-phosphatase n=1 Tax=Streptomyces coelicoflavus TaxID=285562 RepID=UPI000247668B|nr:low molecular weight protein-tyrosine-phosphatase [Streptomyces coelicoflavus]EHN78739.1 low molecular weight protein-tyrosine-phosphatase [Streptomyces coelicoflavus ZG0656]KPC69789.1 protein tyrosine phosphatase [Streptomyces sp. NRRL WC-3753]MZE47439.1 low molecular weight phosphotyrosine protein phosphatase [Streptomyces sp. SID5477]